MPTAGTNTHTHICVRVCVCMLTRGGPNSSPAATAKREIRSFKAKKAGDCPPSRGAETFSQVTPTLKTQQTAA